MTKPYTRRKILNALSKSILTIKFTKLDGNVRTLHGTLMREWIPNFDELTLNPQPSSVIAVFDIDKQEWRAFRIDSILDIHLHDPDNAV